MELYDVMRTTFAARDYTSDRLPDEVLYDILENARFAPSGGNRQGNRVIVVRDPETSARISGICSVTLATKIPASCRGITNLAVMF